MRIAVGDIVRIAVSCVRNIVVVRLCIIGGGGGAGAVVVVGCIFQDGFAKGKQFTGEDQSGISFRCRRNR